MGDRTNAGDGNAGAAFRADAELTGCDCGCGCAGRDRRAFAAARRWSRRQTCRITLERDVTLRFEQRSLGET